MVRTVKASRLNFFAEKPEYKSDEIWGRIIIFVVISLCDTSYSQGVIHSDL